MDNLEDVLARWLEAERRGDALTLEALLDPTFRGDGPDGRVLSKEEWLDRYRSGDLANRAFAWESLELHRHSDTAVATGLQVQTARYRDRDWSGTFRATLVAVADAGRWTIVNVQLSEVEP